MKKVQITAGALRAFEWFARSGVHHEMTIRIHKGSGQCRCVQCEEALKRLDRIIRASKP